MISLERIVNTSTVKFQVQSGVLCDANLAERNLCEGMSYNYFAPFSGQVGPKRICVLFLDHSFLMFHW